MPGESFRFIHASDFHLESPLGDLDELPPPLRDQMATAPHEAVKAVFAAALSNNIDFVVLSGDLLNPQAAGPYGMNLLLEQFEKLAAADTPVYWAAGNVDDPQKWPEAVVIPPNVTLFPKDHATDIKVVRGGRTICRLIGRGSDGRASLHVPGFECEAGEEFAIGVGHGDASLEMLEEARFDFWCLGGKHNRLELKSDDEIRAVYSGSPQGRSLSEPGSHGFSIIDVDAERNVRVSEMPADQFRYCNVRLRADEIAAVGSIENLLGERIVRLQHDAGGRHLIIGWDITADSGESLIAIGDGEALLEWVRREYGHGAPAAWSTSLRIHPPQKYPKSWHEEDTILGDYLRIAAEHRKGDSTAANLLPMTEEHPGLPASTTTLLAEIPQTRRIETLDQATLLGVELLRGGKPNWVNQS
ncbi:putative metallophosphoesterase YhaO [Stieleria neptunia]|uniref:Putative metallophosphoesterase YhaO n=1 Tax=Stieleria neptunia TaxID=2527979 RepID=A0A518I431_9BACT|nr:DNA repair exonuclease [Stieleria neptunia]QDV47859.1 putative metallophosphoesterase YhaO [Stieleria neptunia]